MARRGRIVLGVVPAFVATATLIWWTRSGEDAARSSEDRSDAASDATGRASSVPAGESEARVGVHPRDAESAALVTNWTSPTADLEQVRAAAERGLEPLDLVFADYDANADLAHWASGNADDSEHGDALARCYAKASSLRRDCGWNQRLIVRRSGDRRGEVVHVAQAYERDGIEPACERMIACVNEAWRGAEAPLPAGANDYTTLEFGGIPCALPIGADELERERSLAARESLARETLESMADCDRQACRYNRRDAQACLDHLQKLRELR